MGYKLTKRSRRGMRFSNIAVNSKKFPYDLNRVQSGAKYNLILGNTIAVDRPDSVGRREWS